MYYNEQFQQESRQLHHHRVYIILVIGISVMLLFTVLDYILAPAHFSEFLRYRLFAVCFGGLLLAVNHHDREQRRAWAIGLAWYLCAGVVILVMMHRLGAVTSPYYVGLLVIITFYTSLAPLTTAQTLISGFALVCIYLVSMFFVDSLTDYQMLSLFSNLFFMICFVAIAATQSWADTAARERECLLRAAENDVSRELSVQTEQLEEEVRQRSAEQMVSEKRYQLLFEAITDAVVLISPQGIVLQANQAYLRNFANGSPEGGSLSLYNVVKGPDRQLLQTQLIEPIAAGHAISGYQTTLLTTAQTLFAAEISGILLHRADKVIGLQLVIRDIGVRKQLEAALMASLDKVRHTENAAILALANLSEYRDINPGKHLERIREYCRLLAAELGRRAEFAVVITPIYIQNLYQGAILHDIGKVAIADEILFKKTALTMLEHEVLRNHTLTGGDVIKAMEEEARGSVFLSLAKNIAYFHHERWDGQGYPYGLQGMEIPLEARIMTLADTYEELTASLELAVRLPHQQAMEHIVRSSGQQFDPIVVEAFVARQDDFDRIRMQLAEGRGQGKED